MEQWNADNSPLTDLIVEKLADSKTTSQAYDSL